MFDKITAFFYLTNVIIPYNIQIIEYLLQIINWSINSMNQVEKWRKFNPVMS